MQLNESIDILKGVGKKRKEILENNNIITIQDLLNFIPYRYEDRSKINTFDESLDINSTFKVKVTSKGYINYKSGKQSTLRFNIIDGKGNKGQMIFFNQPYLLSSIKKDDELYIYGKLHQKNNVYQIFAPKFSKVNESENFLKIEPIYRSLDGIPQKVFINMLSEVLDKVHIKDYLPQTYRERYNLLSLNEMYKNLHKPSSSKNLLLANNRIKFDEGLKINTGILTSKLYPDTTDIIINNFHLIDPFLNNLSFDLTNAQELVLGEIFRDLESGYLMNRMIMGDVGSGKTILAIICAYLFSINGLQTAYMAPTEILAKQHYKSFSELLEPFNIKTALLTGSMKPYEIEQVRKELSEGKIDVIIGTHSLFQENTHFLNLGLIVTDEQHRFGVKQRGLLGEKGSAHTLVMSATPIPRSLALTLYGDLDLSEINELPKGRKKVKTSFFTLKKLKKILNFIEKEINDGHQAFIVCPYIETSEEDKSVISVDKAFNEIKKYVNNRYRIERLHGKLKPDEKERIINQFNNKEIDLLIATSIIEVGINVPNVTSITILSADRFGLSQLHQLRGRTGRSDLQSYCFLLSNNTSEETLERMKIIVNNHNGKDIALADLKLRGAGDYFGFNQHGFNNINTIDPVNDKELFEITKETVQSIFTSKKAEDMYCKNYLIEAFKKDTELITMN